MKSVTYCRAAKMKKIFQNISIKLLILAFILCSPLFEAEAFTFLSNLKLGDSHPDVIELQKALNSDPRTRVAKTGPGSQGSETYYFGPLTRSAVLRFQEVYKSEILSPIGLLSPTGYVGPLTRLQLNRLSSASKTAVNPTQVPQSVLLPSNVPQISLEGGGVTLVPNPVPVLYKISPYFVLREEKINLEGTSFAENNEVYIDGVFVFNARANTLGTKIEIIVPDSLTLGEHKVYIKNKSGSIERQSLEVKFILVDEKPVLPEITSITPFQARQSELVTIKGKNFSESENVIFSLLGNTHELISADGQTLQFKPTDFSDFYRLDSVPRGSKISVPIYFYVLSDESRQSQEISLFHVIIE